MPDPPVTRLILVGDAEAFDLLAELGSHLRFDEVHRLDEPPGIDAAPAGEPLALGPGDYVIVGALDGKRRRELLARLLAAPGEPAYVGLCATEQEALVVLLKLSADRVPKAKLDRVAAPFAGSGAVEPAELAIALAADVAAARRRRLR